MPVYRTAETRNIFKGLAFVSPWLVGFLGFTAIPLILVAYYSLCEYPLTKPPVYIGLANYRELFADSIYWQTVRNTAYYAVLVLPLSLVVALSVAMLLNAKIRGLALFRTAYYLPVITPLVVAAIIWSWLYQADTGMLNYYLIQLGVIDEPVRWLGNRATAMPAVIAMNTWKGIGFNMIVFLAGLQAVPQEFYEAADVDGAGWWQKFRRITVPLIAPTTFFLLVINTVGAMKAFTQVFVMTQGGPPGPGGATTTIVYWIYQQAFVYFKMGYASALAYTTFFLLFAVSFMQFRWYVKRVED